MGMGNGIMGMNVTNNNNVIHNQTRRVRKRSCKRDKGK